MRTRALSGVVLLLLSSGCPSSTPKEEPPPVVVPGEDAGTLAPWLVSARVVVSGPDDPYVDCREEICRHNENTDLVLYKGAMTFVHRTAVSQVLGPNSALHVYRSNDDGVSFVETAVLPAPNDRDLRDPHFYVVGDRLHIKALTRLPVISTRDSDVHTIAVETHSDDGSRWSSFAPIGPEGQSFWRIRKQGDVYYTASYEDGDKSVTLFSSKDGLAWTKGAVVYDRAEDTPLETELYFVGNKLLALVRMDGNEQELLGDVGRLRTKVCWADGPAYDAFTCPQELEGQRLDGPVMFDRDGRFFVIARRHIQNSGARKRTSLFELTGDLAGGGPIQIVERGDFPSAGDTAYAGVAFRGDGRVLVSWYSGVLEKDEGWLGGMIGQTNIWHGFVDLAKVPK